MFVEVPSFVSIHESTEEANFIDGAVAIHVGIGSPDFLQEVQPATPREIVLLLCAFFNSRFLGLSCTSESIQEV